MFIEFLQIQTLLSYSTKNGYSYELYYNVQCTKLFKSSNSYSK